MRDMVDHAYQDGIFDVGVVINSLTFAGDRVEAVRSRTGVGPRHPVTSLNR